MVQFLVDDLVLVLFWNAVPAVEAAVGVVALVVAVAVGRLFVALQISWTVFEPSRNVRLGDNPDEFAVLSLIVLSALALLLRVADAPIIANSTATANVMVFTAVPKIAILAITVDVRNRIRRRAAFRVVDAGVVSVARV